MVRTYGILVKKLKEERGSRRSGCRSHSRLMDEGQCIPYNSNLVISAPTLHVKFKYFIVQTGLCKPKYPVSLFSILSRESFSKIITI